MRSLPLSTCAHTELYYIWCIMGVRCVHIIHTQTHTHTLTTILLYFDPHQTMYTMWVDCMLRYNVSTRTLQHSALQHHHIQQHHGNNANFLNKQAAPQMCTHTHGYVCVCVWTTPPQYKFYIYTPGFVEGHTVYVYMCLCPSVRAYLPV